MPAIRGLISSDERKVGHFDDQPAVLEFVNSQRARARWPRSAPPAPTISCAPRSARWCSTSIRPAGCRRDARRPRRGDRRPIAPTTRPTTSAASTPDSPAMRDPNAVVYLVPGVGMITFAKRQGDGAHLRRVLRQRHQRDARRLAASTPMSACPSRRPSTSSTGCSRRPSCSACRSRRALAGRIALVTGGAGGIGTRHRRRGCSREGACVVLADIDAGGARRAPSASFGKRFGTDVVRGVVVRRHRRGGRRRAPSPTRRVEFGGLDILVSNAGIASSAPIEETTLALWNRNMDILATGYFLVVARGASG